MERAIVGFGRDEEGDWVARLSCGHGQHVRHSPPFVERPWVCSEEGRRQKLGVHLDCLRCDALELPEDALEYKRTREFTHESLPAGLRKDHTTKAGVWGRIQLLEGEIGYICEALGVEQMLSVERPGVVAPEVPHRLELRGPVRLVVAFLRVEGDPS